MRWLLSILLSGSVLVMSGPWVRAVELGHVDDFESDIAGWDGASPTLSGTGGPAGEGDGFLLVEANSGNGPGSRLATFNEQTVWKGDYTAAGIQAIDLDIMNMPSSSGDLSMRLVLFGPTSTSNRWTSAEPIIVPNDGLWRHITFPIDPESITRVAGSRSFDQMMSGVVRAMLRHDTDPASGTGTTVRATVGFDNIRLLGSLSDFNVDGVVDVLDVNLLLAEVHAGTNAARFDRTGDGLVDTQDIVHVITLPDELNTYIGDANLDDEFNTSDLVQVLSAGEYEDGVPANSQWETGDWNGDAEFDTGDLVFALAEGGYEQGPRGEVLAVVVPEPASCILTLLGCLLLLAARRGCPS